MRAFVPLISEFWSSVFCFLEWGMGRSPIENIFVIPGEDPESMFFPKSRADGFGAFAGMTDVAM